MELERWHRVDNILQAALALNPAERITFVDSACEGDEALRDEVVSLLSLEAEGLDIIDTPALEAAACVLASAQPDLIEGQFVGHYRILSLLGIGGMGEVYLAEDTKLGRKIALKLLPADFTRDGDRLRRFQQEARAASALNHPYIVTIHETGEFEERHFIATEFIDGETLRQRMRRTPLNLGETFDIAIQVAAALGAAHHAGLVHCDIKPENIMLRPDGYVKVLDFGLAKLAEQSPDGGSSGLHSRETDTTPGLLIGTVKYMSPEQARGLNLDARSDVFSLGVVIYEMLTGRPPFDGETNSDIIAALLEEEATPLSQPLPEVPLELERIVSKALAKEKQKRYQAVQELLIDLASLNRELELKAQVVNSTQPNSSGKAGAGLSRHKARDERAASIADRGTIRVASSAEIVTGETKRQKVRVALVLMLAAVVITLIYGLQNLNVKHTASFQAMRITRLTNNGKVHHAAISPDGKNLVYTLYENGKSSLWLKNLGTLSDIQILPPAEAWYGGLTFSTDGNYIYFNRSDRYQYQPAGATLCQMPVFGGAVRELISGVDSRITLSPDGSRLAFVRNDDTKGESALMIANADGTGQQKLAIRNNSPDQFNAPAWSPNGRVIACSAESLPGDNQAHLCNVIEVRVADGTEKPLSSQWWRSAGELRWLPDGSGLVMIAIEEAGRPLQIWKLSYPDGEARRITNDTNQYWEPNLTADSRMLIATQEDYENTIWITAPNGDPNQPRPITLGANKSDGQMGIGWTPDDKILYTTNASQNWHIWIMDKDGSNRKQLTFGSRPAGGTPVTADGRYVVFTAPRLGSAFNVWRMNVDGSNPLQLTNGRQDEDPQCSPDGKWVVYGRVDSGKPTLWKVSIDGSTPVQLTDKMANAPAAISPDGKLIAYLFLDEQVKPRKWKIAVSPFDGGEPIKVLAISPTLNRPVGIRWTPDGRALAYCDSHLLTSSIWMQPLDGSNPKQLTDEKDALILQFEWSCDGKQLAILRRTYMDDIVMINGIN